MRWSKLQKELYKLVDDKIDLQLQCRVYRMQSQWGSTNLPRYWITLGKDIIWDYPKNFNHKLYPYATDISNISNLIRNYIDTPKNDLIRMELDQWGLVEILIASDRRIGIKRLAGLNLKSPSAIKVVEARLK